MYRFRKTEYLLDERYDELNNQEIYFAPPEELKDPMEGAKDIFWHGDEVLWRNFIKHYLICLEHVTNMWSVVGEDKEINKDFIPVFKSSVEFSSVKHKERFIKIQDYFFSNKIIKNMPVFLAEQNKKIRYNELLKYLKVIHKFAFDAINFVDSNYGYIERISIFKNILNQDSMIKLIESGFDREEEINEDFIFEDEIEMMFRSLNNINSNVELLSTCGDEGEGVFNNKTFIMIQFPEAYLSKMEELIYPKWYAACFMRECTSLSSWGTYGDNHKGVCLKFKTEVNKTGKIENQDNINNEGKNAGENDESKSINLTGVMGSGSNSIIGSENFKLSKVKYDDVLHEIDFFKSLGRLSYPEFNKQWYANEEGEISSTIYEMTFDEEWLNTYREDFHKSITSKSRGYCNECEYRIILDEMFNDYSSAEDRTLKYDFDDLEGIIFGIKTSSLDKAKIINIIREKCRESGRENFDFYEAEYCHESGRIEPVKLDIVI
ncbi:MAG: DUF2971 domain-containing protein [Clostridium sp.]|nr:DUF2971 domain-containing protein [Clostridium sp.]